MRIAVLLGVCPEGDHEVLISGDPKKVKTFAKGLTLDNPTRFKVVRFFDQHAVDYRVHRGQKKQAPQEPKLDKPKQGRGRPKKES